MEKLLEFISYKNDLEITDILYNIINGPHTQQYLNRTLEITSCTASKVTLNPSPKLVGLTTNNYTLSITLRMFLNYLSTPFTEILN